MLAAGTLAASASAAGLISVYSNSMETVPQRGAVVKLSGRSCKRGGDERDDAVEVGKLTQACAYRTPVSAATSRSRPPSGCSAPRRKRCSARPTSALQLRAGGGGQVRTSRLPASSARFSWSRSPPKAPNSSKSPKTRMWSRGQQSQRPAAAAPSTSQSGPEKGVSELRATSARPWSPKPPTPTAGELRAAPRRSSPVRPQARRPDRQRRRRRRPRSEPLLAGPRGSLASVSPGRRPLAGLALRLGPRLGREGDLFAHRG